MTDLTVQGGTTPACAACKYQRKKCSSDCILAPYFPANQPKVFQNVHNLFGVSNIMKILKKLDTNEQKEDAMKSIRYESDMRERFPVYGCLTIIYQLRQQLQEAVEELRYVHAQLAISREQFNCQMGSSVDAVSVSQHPSASIEMTFMINNYCGVFTESHDNVAKPLFSLDTYCDLTRNNNSVPIQGHLVISDAFVIEQEREVSEEYDEMFINTMADDRQSYVETKEPSESSSESPWRDTTQSSQQESKSELRSAAACFSLTSVN